MFNTNDKIYNKFDEIINLVDKVMNKYNNNMGDYKEDYKNLIKTKQDIINVIVPDLVNDVGIFPKYLWNIILNYLEEDPVHNYDLPKGMKLYDKYQYEANKIRGNITGYSFFGINYGINII